MAKQAEQCVAELEAACAIAIAELRASTPRLAELWLPTDSAIFKMGFIAGAGHILSEVSKHMAHP